MRSLLSVPRAFLQERAALRRLYREEFCSEFVSFLEFKSYWNALHSGGEDGKRQERSAPAALDPLTEALELMGLTPKVSRSDFDKGYRELMMRVHPDVAGPNAFAAQLNAARNVIKQSRCWR
jgi:hypothetical protein